MRKVNLLDDMETCRTFTWVITPLKDWQNFKYNEQNVKDRVEWKRLCNGRRNPYTWRIRLMNYKLSIKNINQDQMMLELPVSRQRILKHGEN